MGLSLALVAILFITSGALAMESGNYRLDWFTPLTGSGGGAASSDSYAVNFTVGQTLVGAPDSASYEGCLGYWCGTATKPVSDSIDLLIITPEEFAPALDPLVEHKNATGISTEMITLEEIYEDPALPGVDEPEQIKWAIALYEQSRHVKYVMLVGDVDRFPVRWVAYHYKDAEGLVDYLFPSDLYYADLYNDYQDLDDWDTDGDGYFGEHIEGPRCSLDIDSANLDHVDLYPDVAVGRIPASTYEELENYVGKVIAYENTAFGSDWLGNVLLMAGNATKCEAGLHFEEIQRRFGTHAGGNFQFKNYMHIDTTTSASGFDHHPCFCTENEPLADCLERTGLRFEEQTAIFSDAVADGTIWGGSAGVVPPAEFEGVGFFGWHGHSSNGQSYTDAVNNAGQLTVAFSDGCSDGAFAGAPIGGMVKFLVRDKPYRTADGTLLQVIFSPTMVDTDGDGTAEKYYRILGCSIDGGPPSLAGDRCGGGIFPTMVLSDHFGLDSTAMTPTVKNPKFISNPPPPAAVQPSGSDWDGQNPEPKLFAKFATTGEDTGWIGMVGATKSTAFYSNGELMSQFFRGYSEPYPNLYGRNLLGDMWRSMEAYWLDEVVFARGDDFIWKYSLTEAEILNAYCGLNNMHHALLMNLFGDPSLRVGGVEGQGNRSLYLPLIVRNFCQ